MSRALCRAVLALCLVPGAALGQAGPGPALPERPIPAGEGRISGRVLHAESGAPVAGVQVILLALDEQGQPSWQTAQSDGAGHYRFGGIATGLTYQLGALHAGLPFSGARLSFEPGVPHLRAADLLVRDPRPAAPGDLRLTALRAVLDADAAALTVREIHELRAEGETPLLGTLQAPLLRIPLPPQAVELRARSSDAGLELRPVPTPGAGGAFGAGGESGAATKGGAVGIFGESGGGAAMVGAGAAGESLAILGSLAPGELRVELEYRLPALADAPARFARRLATRIPLLEIYLVDTGDLAPRSKLLHRRRPAREGATNYLRLEAYEVAPGEEVALTVERLPPRNAVSQGAALAAAWALALGAVAVLLGPLVGPFRPLRRAGAESAEGAAHGTAQAAGAARALREEAARAALREEREALYAAIGDLDHDLETGKLSAADHAELRAELRARAIHLLREERDGAESSAEAEGSAASASATEGSAPAEGSTASTSAEGGAAAADSEMREATGAGARAEATPPGAPHAAAPRCAACGFEAAQAHRFCAHCGAPLSAPQPDSAAAAQAPAAGATAAEVAAPQDSQPGGETQSAVQDAAPGRTAQ